LAAVTIFAGIRLGTTSAIRIRGVIDIRIGIVAPVTRVAAGEMDAEEIMAAGVVMALVVLVALVALAVLGVVMMVMAAGRRALVITSRGVV
jgi:hypothetical protein